jgi:hypothetical protein
VAFAHAGERPEQAGVLLLARQDLLARPPGQAVEHGGEPLGRAGRERDLAGRAAERPGVGRAQLLAGLFAGFEVLHRPPAVAGSFEHRRARPGRRGGQRAVRAGVQVGGVLEHREPGAQRVCIHRAAA